MDRLRLLNEDKELLVMLEAKNGDVAFVVRDGDCWMGNHSHVVEVRDWLDALLATRDETSDGD